MTSGTSKRGVAAVEFSKCTRTHATTSGEQDTRCGTGNDASKPIERYRSATGKLESKERQQLVMFTSGRGADYIADGPAGRKLSGVSAYVEF